MDNTSIREEILAELNLCRANPKSYATIVAGILDLFKGNEIHKPGEIPLETQEGPAAVQECIKRLRSIKPIVPLTLSEGMSKAAQDHCNDLGPQGIIGHDGTDGSTAESRIERYGEWDVTSGENCDFGNDRARDIVVSLLVDDGVPGRGHRENILNPDFKVCGIGFGSHAQYKYMCTIDFAGGFTENDKPGAKPKNEPKGKSGNQPKSQGKNQQGLEPYLMNAVCSQVIDEINAARTNPKAYADNVAAVLKLLRGNEIHKPGQIPLETQEGAVPIQECIKRLKAMKPIGPLELSVGMSKAAQDHCDDLGPQGITGHNGTDGSTMESRIERYGEWDVTVGENCDFGNDQARDIVVSLLIDDGVTGRGHRENILNPDFKVAGVGFGSHAQFNHMCTIDFAGGFSESADQPERKAPSSSQTSSQGPGAQGKNQPQGKSSGKPGEVSIPSIYQEVIDELNQCRTNPKNYANVVAEILKFYKGNEIHKPGEIPIETQEGTAPVQEVIKRLKGMKPISPLTLSLGASWAAQDHCDDLGPKGETGHDGTDGSTMEGRIERYGDWDVTVGENIDFGNQNARDIVVSLLIDDGVQGRGHRENILNPAYKVAGVGFGYHKEYKHMCTIDFAGGFQEKGNLQPRTPIASPEEAKNQGKPGQQAKGETQPSEYLELMQEVINEINVVRTNPKAYVDVVQNFLKFYKGNEIRKPGETPIVTQEGPAAVQDCLKRLRAMKPIPPIDLSYGLSLAAQDHCDDIGPQGATGHDGTNGSTTESRIENHGDWDVTIGENIDFGNNNATDIVISWLIDDGVPGRGHRENILNPAYKVAGVGFGSHNEYGYVCTIDFAGGFTDDPNQAPRKAPEETKQPQGKQAGSPAKGGQASPSKGNNQASPAKGPQTGPSKGNNQPDDPSLLQEVINEINACRTNPKAYADAVADILKFYKGKMLIRPGETPIETQEGPAPVQEIIKRLKAMKPIGPLELNEDMSKAAKDHCNDLGPKGETGHDGTDGSTVESRLERYGDWDVTIGENIDFGNNNARDIVVSLLIDDGVPGRGHRENLLNPAYKVAGVGFGNHQEYGQMCTIDFAGGFNGKTAPAKGAQAPKGKDQPAPKGKEQPAPKGKEQPAPKGKEQPAPKGKEQPAPKGKEPAKGKDAKGKDPRSGTAKGKSPNSSIPEGVLLTQDEIDEVKQAFDLFDLDGSGTIDPREISAALASMQDEQDTTMFRLLGGIEELGAAITFEDFLLHINDRLGNRNSKEGVQKIFDLFDSDGSGRISVKNFGKVLRELGDSMTDEEIKETIAKVSSDGVSMTVDDFYNVMTKRNYA